jgi:hypothetical protein
VPHTAAAGPVMVVPGWSGTGGGAVVRAGWATMVANNATSAAAKFSVSALWPCQ